MFGPRGGARIAGKDIVDRRRENLRTSIAELRRPSPGLDFGLRPCEKADAKKSRRPAAGSAYANKKAWDQFRRRLGGPKGDKAPERSEQP